MWQTVEMVELFKIDYIEKDNKETYSNKLFSDKTSPRHFQWETSCHTVR